MAEGGRPTGTVTLLFTDIEGSTKLWEAYPELMRTTLARHDALMREAASSGYVFKTIGDAFCVAFETAPQAISAVLAAQLAFASEAWPVQTPVKVRMALHTGAVESRDDDYFGQPLNRVARLLATGHGGQVLLSQPTYDLVRDNMPSGTSLKDLGVHQLKDLARPEQVYQVLCPGLEADFAPIRSLSTHPNNLPQQVTSFIGRDRELGELKELLSRSRLLTLTGSGGSGKTRLSLQIAAESLEQFPDGAWFIELASITDPDLVPRTVASVLGLKEEAGRPLVETLIEHLKAKKTLLLLDNCEHLVMASAKLAETLIRNSADVRILASSREALGITGEQIYPVPSLSTPEPGPTQTSESVSHFEAVTLFIDRALAAKPDFQVTNQNAPSLASVCYRLDGIPLAIELAAARIRTLTVADIDLRLDQRFRLLTGGSRTALPRQQTLRSLIDWSYDLLNREEKLLFSRLCVFAGGWTFEAAEQVSSGLGIDEWEILDLLTSLTDKSLIVAESPGGTTRYRLLETVRQYARDRLMEGGEGGHWRDRHLAYFLYLAEQAEPQLTGPDQAVWMDRLEHEHDNFRSAMEWSRERPDDPDSGTRVAGALWRFWMVRGFLVEGRNWLKTMTAKQSISAPHAKALYGMGALARYLGDFTEAKAFLEESLAIWRQLGDKPGMAAPLNGLGIIAEDQGEFAKAQTLYEESLAIRRELGDRRGVADVLNNLGTVAIDVADYATAKTLYEEGLAIKRELGDQWGIATMLENLGVVAYIQDDHKTTRALCEESLAIKREIGDRWGTANSLNDLGIVAYHLGEFETSRELIEEALTIRRQMANRSGIVHSLEALAGLANAMGAPAPAVRLWASMERVREEIDFPLPPSHVTRYVKATSQARAMLGDDQYQELWKEGRAMTMEQAIELAPSVGR